MFTIEQARAALDGNVYTTDGEKIGKVGQIYLDDETNEPEWVTVTTGLFGTRESFVPLADAQLDGDRVVVPFDKNKIKDAPQIDSDSGQISPEEEGQLYRYYGKDYGDERSDSGMPEGSLAASGTDRPGTSPDADRDATSSPRAERAGTSIDTDSDLTSTDADRDVSRADTERAGTHVDTDADFASERSSDRSSDRASEGTLGQETSGSSTDDALRRAEESLNASMASGRGGRVRLRKYIVTEEQTITVPVSREEVRVERDSDTDSGAGSDTGMRSDAGTDAETIDVRGQRSASERTT